VKQGWRKKGEKKKGREGKRKQHGKRRIDSNLIPEPLKNAALGCRIAERNEEKKRRRKG